MDAAKQELPQAFRVLKSQKEGPEEGDDNQQTVEQHHRQAPQQQLELDGAKQTKLLHQ
jgi:hypothetical protein